VRVSHRNTVVVRATNFLDPKRVLLAVRGGPHVELALEIANRLALSLNGETTVLHCDEESFTPKFRDRAYRLFLHRLQSHRHARRLIALHGDAKAAIIREGQEHDMIIVGAGSRAEPREHFLGPIVEHVAQGTDKPLMVVKTPSLSVSAFNGNSAEKRSRPLSQWVDKCFPENTFHRREFDDLKKLVDLKKKNGLTISLGLPALNEAETVGEIARAVKQLFSDEVPLRDEKVLIDSGSTDDTVSIARDLGIGAFVHQQVLPSWGSYRGEGEALWKSLYVLKCPVFFQ
jgi:glucosyl-3-phosphoglycerate synthase